MWLIALGEFQSFTEEMCSLTIEEVWYNIIVNRPKDEIVSVILIESKSKDFVLNIELKINIYLQNKNKILIKGKLYQSW